MSTPAHLRSSRDIREVFEARRAGGTATLVVHVCQRSQGSGQPVNGQVRSFPDARVAVIASRRVGGAVARNRAKRRLRAALREAVLPEQHDVVVSAKAPAVDAPFPRLVADLEKGLQRAVEQPPQSRGAGG